MGQLLSSEDDVSQVKDALGSLLYDAMLEGGAIPELGVVHPFLLANHEDLQQLQGDIGNRAPAYLKDLINRLATFSDEPRLAGLVGLVVTMVIDMAYTSSKPRVKRQSSGSASCQQRMWELQEAMEEYLKRCRINLSDKSKLIQDCVRLEAQVSLTLTQLKTCLLVGECDSRSLRHWASGASFHTQMLVHLAGLEGQVEPLAARAAMEQYKEDLTQMIPAYRSYKSNTVSAVKCRGGPLAPPSSEVPENGAMTGLTVTDRETGKSATIPLSVLETCTGRRLRASDGSLSSFVNPDLISSDQYVQAYLDRLFSDQGPVAELENYFTKACDYMRSLVVAPTCKRKTGVKTEQSNRAELKDQAGAACGEQTVDKGKDDEQPEKENMLGSNQGEESLKLSVVETQPDDAPST